MTETDLANKYGLTVLYEDNHLLVVEKPVNVPVQADISGDPDLCSVCKQYRKENEGKPGEAYIGIVHRLDRPVGGVLVFAKTSKAADRLTRQFKSHEARKKYIAVVDGNPKPEERLTDYLIKDERTNTSHVVPGGTEGAKEARLSYRLIGREETKSLLDISLYTGRPHQIRVQLSHAGYPIIGDQRYHPSAMKADSEKGKTPERKQICLWAYSLTIKHPTLNEEMTFFSIPKGNGWNRFSPQMAMLPAQTVCSGIYLDENIIVCDKNVGVEVEGDLLSELSSIFPAVYPVHRLDANTMGLVIFARNEKMQEQLERSFYEHDIQKTYLAVVLGKPQKDSSTLVHYAKKDVQEATVRLCGKDEPDSLRMELDYSLLKTENGCSLVRIDLHTGRTHQIRVQMAAIGNPIVGDDKYGDRDANRHYRIRTQQLLCKRLAFDKYRFESFRELRIPEIKE